MDKDFSSVTELAGEPVPQEQVERLIHRYAWAGAYCQDQDVLEVACGDGQGLAHLANLAGSLRAGDISPVHVERVRRHYSDRIQVQVMDALMLPFPDASLDVVIIFEAIYYLESAQRFVVECHRVLRPGGRVLLATANKDLWDFNPSPHSVRYYGVEELGRLFSGQGFDCEFFGNVAVDAVSWRQRLFRPLKKLAVKWHLVPKTMVGKKLLKRLVFGRLIPMPAEVEMASARYSPPTPLSAGKPDRRFKVIYLAARKY